MLTEELPARPPLPWRLASTSVMGLAGFLSRSFLYGLCNTQVHGLDTFLRILDERSDVSTRERGLLTVSNHVSVVDDPMIWGTLPFRYHYRPDNLRWSLASHDICFQSRFTSSFFTYGQTLPTHRLAHSPFGGLFQPTMTQAIRLLSAGPFHQPTHSPMSVPHPPSLSTPSSPLSSSSSPNPNQETKDSTSLTYTTTTSDTFPSPSAYSSRRLAWVHIFPEGRVHQRPDRTMRYFKWGVARLILEAEPCPDVVPMWIEGPEQVMPEARRWPRFVPRPGKEVSVTFGERVSPEVWEPLRERWRVLVSGERRKAVPGGRRDREGGWVHVVVDERVDREGEEVGGRSSPLGLGILTEELMYGSEAVRLREECTMMVRKEVLKVRTSRGLPDEDPKAGLVDTWIEEGATGKREGKMDDDSWVGRT